MPNWELGIICGSSALSFYFYQKFTLSLSKYLKGLKTGVLLETLSKISLHHHILFFANKPSSTMDSLNLGHHQNTAPLPPRDDTLAAEYDASNPPPYTFRPHSTSSTIRSNISTLSRPVGLRRRSRPFAYGYGLGSANHKEHQTWIRCLIVCSYFMFVSSPALLLTFYYTRVWDPTYLNKIPRTRIPEPEPSKLQQSSTTMTNSISVKLNKNGSSSRTQRDSPYIPVFSSDDANVKSSDNFVNHLATLEVLPNNAAATEQTKQFSLHDLKQSPISQN